MTHTVERALASHHLGWGLCTPASFASGALKLLRQRLTCVHEKQIFGDEQPTTLLAEGGARHTNARGQQLTIWRKV